jgi:hypothetical protein
MEDFSNDTAGWMQDEMDAGAAIDCELGTLIAAASGWTEDETDLNDLIGGLVETGFVQLSVG